MKGLRFKVSSNLVFQISTANYMSADQAVDQLMQYEGFTLKSDNRIRCIGNLLYNNHAIESAAYDALTGEIVLDISDSEYVPEEVELSE